VVPWDVCYVAAHRVLAPADVPASVLHERWACPRHAFASVTGASFTGAQRVLELDATVADVDVPFDGGQNIFPDRVYVLPHVVRDTCCSVNLAAPSAVDVVLVGERERTRVSGAASCWAWWSRTWARERPERDVDGRVVLCAAEAAVLVVSRDIWEGSAREVARTHVAASVFHEG